jgi:prepilin-type N-terminal cleavage/methylation domain-containing protein/prepilin-type processing-associated H-X9-DG protein
MSNYIYEAAMMLRSRTGFTMVEILVAIAVLAILLGILMPVFSRAKECAQQVKCASNLRQLAASFSMYVDDWGGFYPSPGGLPGDQNYWSQSGSGGLSKYAGNKPGGANSIWCCPCMKEWNSPFPARTYCMNSYLRTPADKQYPGCIWIKDPIRQDAVPLPRSTILLYEGYQNINSPPAGSDSIGVSTYRCGDWTTVKGWFTKSAGGVLKGEVAWHNGTVNNYLYCDGHVKCRKPGKFTPGMPQGATWEEAREWYVDKDGHRSFWE